MADEVKADTEEAWEPQVEPGVREAIALYEAAVGHYAEARAQHLAVNRPVTTTSSHTAPLS